MWFVLTAKLINVPTALNQARRNAPLAKKATTTKVLQTNAMIATTSLMPPPVMSAKAWTNASNAAMATASVLEKMKVVASLVIQATVQTVTLKRVCAFNANLATTKVQENVRNVLELV